jgi:phage terminase large subunit
VHYSAKNILKESKSYQWKQSADGSPLEEPVKMFDHAMDALRYAIVGMTDKVQGPIQVIKYKDRVK